MQTIYLDISNKGVVPIVYAKQGDVGRKFEVVLTDSGLPYVPASGSAFSVWYSGPSGEGNYTGVGDKSAFSVNGNKVIVEMITQMLSNEGEGVLSLVLNDINGNQIGLWNIRYVCESVPGAESEKAKEYYTAFSESVKELSDAESILKSKLSVDGSNAMEANLPMNGHRVTGLGEPAADGDAVPLGYANDHFAPAGHGLGGAATPKNWDEIDSLITNGKYQIGSINQTINGIYVTSACVEVVYYGYNYGKQFLHTAETASGLSESYTLERSRGYVGWGPWECKNPPMVLGVEYRTTKRHKGNPVYARLIDLADLVSNGTRYYQIAVSGALSEIVTYEIQSTNGGVTTNLELETWANVSFSIPNNNLTLTISTSLAGYNYSGTALMEYTKTT